MPLLLLLLLLSCFSCVRLCATPQMATYRPPRPWDSPGKNTGVDCHFLLQCMQVKSESEVSDSSRPHGLQPSRLLHPWDFPGKSTGVGCHCPQLIFYRIFFPYISQNEANTNYLVAGQDLATAGTTQPLDDIYISLTLS